MRKPRIHRKGIGYKAPNPTANKRKEADPKKREDSLVKRLYKFYE